MPNLGQGGCQAIEDAYVLTETLAAAKSTAKLQDSLQNFYKKRILRVSIVQFLSRLASDLIINAFDTPWSPHDDLGKSWKSYLTFFWKVRAYCHSSSSHVPLGKHESNILGNFVSACLAICNLSDAVRIPLFILPLWRNERDCCCARGKMEGCTL